MTKSKQPNIALGNFNYEDQKKPTISYSQLWLYLTCPEKWYLRYIKKLKEPRASALFVGNVSHTVFAANLEHKVEHGEYYTKEQVADMFSDTYEMELVDPKQEEVVFKDDMPKDKLKDRALGAMMLHCDLVAPKLKPYAVEQQYVISLGDDCPYDFRANIDLIEVDGTIVDHKMKQKSPPANNDHHMDLQLSLYSLVFRTLNQRAEKGLRLDNYVLNKTPKFVPLETTRTNEQIMFSVKTLEGVATAIKAGMFYPNTKNMMCGENKCGYWKECAGKPVPEIYLQPKEDKDGSKAAN